MRIYTTQKSGLTLVARIFLAGTQQGSDISLTEIASSGYYYSGSVSVAALADDEYAVLFHDGTSYMKSIGHLRVVDGVPYEEFIVSHARSILADTNDLQTNQGNWLTADISSLATTSQLNSQTSYLETHGDTNWSTATPPSESQIADAVWDELVSGHMTPGTFGYALYSAVVYGGQNGAWLELLLKYHNNKVVFFEADGTTETTQGDAYFMTVYDDDGTTVLKRIEFKDAAGDPAKLSLATKYIKT